MPLRISVIFAICCALISGCASLDRWKANGFKVGPNYRKPVVETAAAWVDANDASVVMQRDHIPDWWRGFNDPTLEQLIHAAFQQNLSLRAAGLRVCEARKRLEIAGLNLLPQSQTASGAYSRNQLSINGANAIPGLNRNFDAWQTGFDLAWELDVWGRIRRSIEASSAALDAEVENYDDILVTLIGDVAASYIELRSFDERINLAEENVAIQSGSLKLAELREEAGRVSELDVEQAKSNLADTRALIPTLRQGRRIALNRIAILLGMTPYELQPLLQQRCRLPDIPDQVIVDIPANLLRRRPDIRQVERQVAAQSAQIGIAEAELYPQFALSGNINLSSQNLSNLVSSGSVAGSIAPAFRWNILNYGRIKRNVCVEELRFQQAIVNYQNVVLAAHREVEDSMTQFIESKLRANELEKSTTSAARSVELVRAQYKEGKVDFGRVFVLESALVQRQDQLIATKAQIAIAAVRTYKAMGGGWQIRLSTPYHGSYPTNELATFCNSDWETSDHSPTIEPLPSSSSPESNNAFPTDSTSPAGNNLQVDDVDDPYESGDSNWPSPTTNGAPPVEPPVEPRIEDLQGPHSPARNNDVTSLTQPPRPAELAPLSERSNSILQARSHRLANREAQPQESQTQRSQIQIRLQTFQEIFRR